MKGVILAAGVSSRLRPLTDHIPKCLLEPGGGRPILGMALENLIANGIGDVVLVTGYREDLIRAYVHDAYPALHVRFITNAQFENTNNSYSLWLTERAVGDGGIVLLDSDIVFDRRIISLLARSGHDNALALSRGKSLGEEEIKVQVSPDGSVHRIGKDVPPGDAAGESIGIEILSPGFLRSLYRILGRMITNEKNVNSFYEAAFQEVISAGSRMAAVDVGDLQSIEIDTAEDLEAARAVAAMLPGAARRWGIHRSWKEPLLRPDCYSSTTCMDRIPNPEGTILFNRTVAFLGRLQIPDRGRRDDRGFRREGDQAKRRRGENRDHLR